MVKKFKKGGFSPKEKEKIIQAGKEIKIDKVEAQSVKMLSGKMDSISIQMGLLRTDFVMKERRLISQLSQFQAQMMTIMKNFKDKYKIVGKIKDVDYEKNKIILE